MNLLALSPALKAAAGLAVGVAFAFTASRRAHGGNAGFNAGTINVTPRATAFVEKVPTPPVDFPTVTLPTPAPRPTVDPASDKGGVFADGVSDLTLVDKKGWLTYTNTRWGYTFMYPATWVLEAQDA